MGENNKLSLRLVALRNGWPFLVSDCNIFVIF